MNRRDDLWHIVDIQPDDLAMYPGDGSISVEFTDAAARKFNFRKA